MKDVESAKSRVLDSGVSVGMCSCVDEQYIKGQVIDGPYKTCELYLEGSREPRKVLS